MFITVRIRILISAYNIFHLGVYYFQVKMKSQIIITLFIWRQIINAWFLDWRYVFKSFFFFIGTEAVPARHNVKI